MKKNKKRTTLPATKSDGTSVGIKAKQKAASKAVYASKIYLINKDALLFSGIALVLFLIIRHFYPVPDLIPDSKGYILGAITDSEMGYRPMGISLTLARIHQLDPSIEMVAYCQFFLHVMSALTLSYAFLINFNFSAVWRRVLYAVLLLNPVLLHLCNAIFSDSLFISLNILWVAFFMYLIRKPNWLILASLLLLLWCSMFVRYNALAYPLVVAVGLLFVSNKTIRWIGIAASFAIAAVFYITVTNKMDAITNCKVLSGFSGWQLATNAMTFYKAKPRAPIGSNDPELIVLDSNCRKYIDAMASKDASYRKGPALDFLWGSDAPFKRFEYEFAARTQATDLFANWVAVSVVLDKYGTFLIKQYPFDFLRYYLLPNTGAYFFPEMEVLDKYGAVSVKLIPALQQWYDLPEHIQNGYVNAPGIYNKPGQYLYSFLSIAFVGMCIAWWVNRKKWVLTPNTQKVLFMIIIFWLCKTGFDILAAPCVLRYEVMLVSILCGPVLIFTQVILTRWGKEKELKNL
ncbi:MAG: hypothetical protein P4L41_07695 [Flavipsychrobacter sp.]|nr:hypothetical protein [Flavipsychrobacter sp.]